MNQHTPQSYSIKISLECSRTFVLLLLTLLLGGGLSACAILPGRNTPDAMGVPSGEVIFADDFSIEESGWRTWYDNDGSQVVYQNSGLRFVINKTDYDSWSIQDMSYADTRIEVDSIMVNGPDDNHFGVICRYQDDGNFYALLLTSDGYYGILMLLDNQYHLLSGENLLYSEQIHQGFALNHIRADCLGEELSLYANDQLIISVHDSTFSKGKAGLMVGTYDSAGVDILFDNYRVIQP